MTLLWKRALCVLLASSYAALVDASDLETHDENQLMNSNRDAPLKDAVVATNNDSSRELQVAPIHSGDAYQNMFYEGECWKYLPMGTYMKVCVTWDHLETDDEMWFRSIMSIDDSIEQQIKLKTNMVNKLVDGNQVEIFIRGGPTNLARLVDRNFIRLVSQPGYQYITRIIHNDAMYISPGLATFSAGPSGFLNPPFSSCPYDGNLPAGLVNSDYILCCGPPQAPGGSIGQRLTCTKDTSLGPKLHENNCDFDINDCSDPLQDCRLFKQKCQIMFPATEEDQCEGLTVDCNVPHQTKFDYIGNVDFSGGSVHLLSVPYGILDHGTPKQMSVLGPSPALGGEYEAKVLLSQNTIHWPQQLNPGTILATLVISEGGTVKLNADITQGEWTTRGQVFTYDLVLSGGQHQVTVKSAGPKKIFVGWATIKRTGDSVCFTPDDSKDAGHVDSYRGWYDVTGCGNCNDYCRWVGNSGSGGDPSTNLVAGSSWWSCDLVSSQSAYTPQGHFDTWSASQCAGKGSPACKPRDTPTDLGYVDSYRGWYDVTGCGECNDYCRWVGNSGSGGDPRTRLVAGTSYWTCMISGSGSQKTPQGHFDTWSASTCTEWTKLNNVPCDWFVATNTPVGKVAATFGSYGTKWGNEIGTWNNLAGADDFTMIENDDRHWYGLTVTNGVAQNYKYRFWTDDWVEKPYAFKYMAMSDMGNLVVGIKNDDTLWYATNNSNNFVNFDGGLVIVALSGNGKKLVGVDSTGAIWCRNGVTGSWKAIPGGDFYGGYVTNISLNYDATSIYAVTNLGDVFHKNGLNAAWEQKKEFKRDMGDVKQIRMAGEAIYVVAGATRSIWHNL